MTSITYVCEIMNNGGYLSLRLCNLISEGCPNLKCHRPILFTTLLAKLEVGVSMFEEKSETYKSPVSLTIKTFSLVRILCMERKRQIIFIKRDHFKYGDKVERKLWNIKNIKELDLMVKNNNSKILRINNSIIR